MNNLAILQGRILPPYTDRLQVFPDKWQEELALISSLGFSYVELLDDKENKLRSLLREDKESFLNALRDSNLKVASVCMDNLAGISLLNETQNFLSGMEDILSLLKEFPAAFVLPFFDENSVSSAEEFSRAVELISKHDSKLALGQSISLEANLPAAVISEALSQDFRNIKVCYDLGNMAGEGADLEEEINILGSRINHVHVKDKVDGKNVRLRKGRSEMISALSALSKNKYKGIFALETNPFPDSLEEAQLNLQTITGYMEAAE